jgi:hypothetical protein
VERLEIRASPEMQRQGKERGHDTSLKELANDVAVKRDEVGDQESCGASVYRAALQRRRGGGEVFLSGVAPQKEKSF